MPKVNIEYPSQLNAQETFTKVKDLLENDPGLRKIDNTIKCDFDDSQMKGTANGTKFKANMSVVASGDKANVTIIVDLPMLLGAFKGQVRSTIERKLSAILS